MTTKLSTEQIEAALAGLEGWQVVEADGTRAIERTYRFADFAQAMVFVNQVAQEAEAAAHHPDIQISYNRVKLTLTTHDAGGLTTKDFELAAVLQGSVA
ncbi:4a-hydroxytetrahydrobiopterin dehydratase [Gloeobacter kilaueensis]|uniref:Putative pterin-4-alpha-carbinolamine dehydratase n=1 Tax=Gloeobacter kilaueensis (strain ATCC BAA-2537 / CCAP 1431/1 / ULC 316 / JS1) TaxID=1183438 RepID=U5QHC0_GLOK1|nr:4a-hydroxytetrahydrobiopterin dehydratase [Gloeobacter kilaueensis]AGY57065.1 pterin-4-alpha-carbinolamine dehydratase [Gloeobacter kilaueensis JS1]